MKRFASLLLVLAFFGCGGFGAEKRYKQFAEEMLHRRYDAAAAMCEGLSASDLAQAGTQEHIGAGPQMFQTIFPSRFQIDSTEKNGDDVILHSVQTVLFNPPGVESAMRPAMYATMKQTTTLRKSGGEWKVVRFENAFEKMDSVTAGR